MQIHHLQRRLGGIVVIFDPANSAVAKAMKIKEKGRYALKVR